MGQGKTAEWSEKKERNKKTNKKNDDRDWWIGTAKSEATSVRAICLGSVVQLPASFARDPLFHQPIIPAGQSSPPLEPENSPSKAAYRDPVFLLHPAYPP